MNIRLPILNVIPYTFFKKPDMKATYTSFWIIKRVPETQKKGRKKFAVHHGIKAGKHRMQGHIRHAGRQINNTLAVPVMLTGTIYIVLQ